MDDMRKMRPICINENEHGALGGCIDDDFIWVLNGTILHRCDRHDLKNREIVVLPNDFEKKYARGSNLRCIKNKIIIASEIKPEILVVDRWNLSYSVVGPFMPRTSGNCFSIFLDLEVLLISTNGKYLIRYNYENNKTTLINLKELILRELNVKEEIKRLRPYDASFYDGLLYVVTTIGNTNRIIKIDLTNMALRECIINGASGIVNNVMHNDDFLWMQLFGHDKNELLQYDLSAKRIVNKWCVTNDKRMLVSFYKNVVGIVCIREDGQSFCIDKDFRMAELSKLPSGKVVFDNENLNDREVLCSFENKIYLVKGFKDVSTCIDTNNMIDLRWFVANI